MGRSFVNEAANALANGRAPCQYKESRVKKLTSNKNWNEGANCGYAIVMRFTPAQGASRANRCKKKNTWIKTCQNASFTMDWDDPSVNSGQLVAVTHTMIISPLCGITADMQLIA